MVVTKPGFYLTGLREDNLLDGLIGGNGGCNPTGGGWSNGVTGLGTFGRDKVMQGSYSEPLRIDDPQLTALFNGNDLAQRIVMDRPTEMFRRGWVLTIQPDAKPGDPGAPPAQQLADPRAAGNESGPAAPGAPLVDPMGVSGVPAGTPPDNTLAPAAPGAAKSDPMGEQLAKGVTAPTGSGAGTPPAAVSAPAKPTSSPEQAPPGKAAKGKDGPEDQGQGADVAVEVEAYGARLNMIPRFLEAFIFGRLYGGGLLIVGADDGQDMSTPLKEDQIKTVRYLTWIDRRFIFASSWYAEIGPKYGEVETYEIINPFGGQSNTRIHESRVIRFDGAPVDFLMRRRLLGWTLSVLQAPYDVMRQFDTSYQAVSNLMADISQAVMKINGLAQLISNDQKTLQTRMAMVDMSRSAARMLYIDAENEEFERVPTPLTGVADTIQMQMLRVSAAAREPVALLFGREPSGLNATGDADFRRFYNVIAGEQKTDLEPRLRRMYTLICLAKDGPTSGKAPQKGFGFTWHKLYEPSEKEQSEIRWNMAQTDSAYVAAKVLLPEEVASSRFRSGDLNLDTEIDLDKRREALKTAELPPTGAEAAKQEHDQAMALASAKGADKPGDGPPKPGAKPPVKK